VIPQILALKGKIPADDPKLRSIVESVRDDPVRLRPLRYTSAMAPVMASGLAALDIVSTGDLHQIHHLKEKGYVERPARVQSIFKGLDGAIPYAEHRVKHFPESHITAVHAPRLVRFIKEAATRLKPNQLLYPNVFPIRHPDRIPKTWDMRAGYYCIDTFTPLTANAFKAARRAVDAAMTGAERVLKGARHCYVVCRPPGHHAETEVFGGFCYFNNAAIAAHYLSRQGRVAFIDIDYHHGNGSQQIFYRRADVLFVSLHGHPRLAYPYFSGFAEERGEGEGAGFNRNYPLYPGTTDERYCETLARAIERIRRFRPDFLVISLGFDIMAGDPTGTFVITQRGMERIGLLLGGVARPTLVVQEGGYSLRNLRIGAPAFLRGLLA
jgi:acetoin utilization deacetylase AcuC-like enzyme